LSRNAPLSIAVCIASFNRREKTLPCLRHLRNAFEQTDFNSTIYLLDDASSDGTADTVIKSFPQIKILHGNGQHYWAGGMRVAYGEALKDQHDYFIWLNDDVILDPDSILRAVSTIQGLAAEHGGSHIVVGAMRDPLSQTMTYSGLAKKPKALPWKFEKIAPWPDRAKPCDTVNGNFILIPREAALKIGNIPLAYVQTLADFDLGLAARRAAIRCWIAPGFLGQCSANETGRMNWKSKGLTLRERWMKLEHPLGYPFWPNFTFARRNFPFWLPLLVAAPYFSLLKSHFLGIRSSSRKQAES
jgi:GT2 family glycosyltransferase